MTPVELSRTVLHAVRRAVDAGELSVAVPARAVVAPPGPGGAGDYATNIALQLARPAGQPPLRVAEVLRPYLARVEGVTGVEITGPGFLNISLDHLAASTGLVRRIRGEGLRYGHTDALAGQVLELRVPFEVRAEVLADALARIVASQGGRVATHHRGASGESSYGRASLGTSRYRELAVLADLTGRRELADSRHRESTGSSPSLHREPLLLRPHPAPEDPTPLGLDAACWALLHPAPHDRPRITADHLVQRESNPLFRIRYAHARTRALTRNAADLGFTAEPGPVELPVEPPGGKGRGKARGTDVTGRSQDFEAQDFGVQDFGAQDFGVHPDPSSSVPTPLPPTTPPPPLLLPLLADYPRILATVTALPRPEGIAAPSRLARHLVAVADATLLLLPVVLPRGEEKPSAAHRARLALAEAAGTVLAGGLSLLGIDAPDHL
ncbi:ArgS-related anticodon-binding protein NrtL [Streptomyces sp. NPDC096132]|uniref:ArgS-related anticodon-binding protein NrtL n=1 Tax=Streptomyces sp. NPDC096132 TaxID=3366075 RepID=UPI003811CCDB